MKEVCTLPKQARALRTYDAVLDAAAYEFARYGYANTNLQKIADQIGLTKGALYGHFSNKEELAAVLSSHLTTAVELPLGEAKASTGPALGRLRTLMLTLGELFQGDVRARAALRLALETAQASGVTAPLLEETHSVVFDLVGEVQREGHWEASASAKAVADLLVAAFFSVFWMGSAHERPEPGSRVAAMWNVLSHALRGKPGQ
ncbi:TetR/AcrR family transcriptional regulator [Streptomyces alboniger]|uniref:TetR/AcrR family transcriptional regulator n=1 Tax=Streptomyces alboniger TaxID=132473 RepID=A0A5J6HIJ8_STRAD|nr:TetR/AcrR family transcriptional regulator [Streptomyces alboniger]